MLSRLVEQSNKPITQVVAAEALKRGTPLEGGEYFADVPKNYDGVYSVMPPREKDSENIAVGDRYNRIPTRIGERYATTELTVGSLSVGDRVTVSGGKFVAGSNSDSWLYQGVYANPYDLDMYIVEKVPAGA